MGRQITLRRGSTVEDWEYLSLGDLRSLFDPEDPEDRAFLLAFSKKAHNPNFKMSETHQFKAEVSVLFDFKTSKITGFGKCLMAAMQITQSGKKIAFIEPGIVQLVGSNQWVSLTTKHRYYAFLKDYAKKPFLNNDRDKDLLQNLWNRYKNPLFPLENNILKHYNKYHLLDDYVKVDREIGLILEASLRIGKEGNIILLVNPVQEAVESTQVVKNERRMTR